MCSRRDFIKGNYRQSAALSDRIEDLTEAIASDFSDEMLYMEMMKQGIDPANLSRAEMLHQMIKLMQKE